VYIYKLSHRVKLFPFPFKCAEKTPYWLRNWQKSAEKQLLLVHVRVQRHRYIPQKTTGFFG